MGRKEEYPGREQRVGVGRTERGEKDGVVEGKRER